MIKKQFTIYLENRPGRLARLTRLLAKEKVNIEGLSVMDGTDVGLVQLVASHAARTRALLKANKLAFSEQDVYLISLENEPGALSQVVSKLGLAKVNINYVYATACNCKDRGCKSNAIISAPDLKALDKVCKSL
jgi:hypothetical protein